jgi:hypothetical protein
MIHTSDIYAFCITIFIALIFVNPGLYLSDELAPANQLYQISNGMQLVYHEGPYGIYKDGTPLSKFIVIISYSNGTRTIIDKSIIGSHYVMIYPLLLPILSLPIYLIISAIPDASRIAPLILWGFILLSITHIIVSFYKNKFHNITYLYAVTGIILLINLIYYSTISTNLEVIAIVLTNILLYGIFGTYIWKFISYMFEGDYKQIVVWIAVMASSSLLFWVSVLKDHVIISLLFIMILYYIIKFYDSSERYYLIVSAILTGLIIWERPELSIAIAPTICLLLLYKFKNLWLKPTFVYCSVMLISLIPAMINNYIVTKSPFKFPYQAVGQTLGGFHLTSSSNIFNLLIFEIPLNIWSSISTMTVDNIIGIMIYPINGGVGLLPFIMLSIFAILLIPYFSWYKGVIATSTEKILYIFSFITCAMYLFTTAIGFTLHAESGILPDMRYFVLIYAPLSIASLSIFNRVYIMNYKSLIRKFVIWFGIMIVGFTICVTILSNGIITMQSINLSTNILALGIFAISSAVIIDTIRTNRVDGLESVIAMIISLPLIWQMFISIFVVKLYSSPMILPIIDLIKKLIIG